MAEEEEVEAELLELSRWLRRSAIKRCSTPWATTTTTTCSSCIEKQEEEDEMNECLDWDGWMDVGRMDGSAGVIDGILGVL